MLEIALQSLVVSGVRINGGFAIKLANRFLVGVPDLLVHIPGCPTSLWEVKKNPEPYLGTKMKLGVTPAQYHVLDNFYRRGGVCGVISFLVGRQNLQCGVFNMDKVHSGVYANDKDYRLLSRGHREQGIYEALKQELDRHKPVASEP